MRHQWRRFAIMDGDPLPGRMRQLIGDFQRDQTEATGITVGVTTGVEAGASFMGMGASASLETSISTSIELGYTRRYSVQTFRNRIVAVTYNVPTNHAGALWSDTHELLPIRGNSTLVSRSSVLLHSGSYTGRTHPHTPDTPPTVDPVPTSEQIEAAKEQGISQEQLVKELAKIDAASFVTDAGS
ncbi:hypothetical protein [Streptomyces natalensis]|uniref:Uncharacterized protein n=1 Tax=Streptomyces natalensis ATCC 27448 TaxID=1240678 RepID=A0A0D7CNB4_9ACTN|nr:hypothetical protein [Streptomyces natalensis]KIZ17561.1 hypothetical protein SNA_13810 [Streptomyces natalensis ATCC 27448]